jgi:DNA-directed RNA polymerase
MGLNMILFFNRKSSWSSNRYKWVFVGIFFTIGVTLSLINGIENVSTALSFWGLMTPVVFSVVDYGFKCISKLIHNRDYYLWLRGSSELKKKFKASDKVISMTNLCLIILLPFLPVFFK